MMTCAQYAAIAKLFTKIKENLDCIWGMLPLNYIIGGARAFVSLITRGNNFRDFTLRCRRYPDRESFEREVSGKAVH